MAISVKEKDSLDGPGRIKARISRGRLEKNERVLGLA